MKKNNEEVNNNKSKGDIKEKVKTCNFTSNNYYYITSFIVVFWNCYF